MVLADDRRVSSETTLPQAVAENDDLLLFLGGEKAAAQRHAKLSDVEEVAGGGLSPDALGLAVAFATHRSGEQFVIGRDSGEGLRLLADIVVERPGEVIAAGLPARLHVERSQGSTGRRPARVAGRRC